MAPNTLNTERASPNWKNLEDVRLQKKCDEAEGRLQATGIWDLLWPQLTQVEKQAIKTRSHSEDVAAIWADLRGMSLERAVIDVAMKTDLMTKNVGVAVLSALGELTDEGESRIEWARKKCRLVLCEAPRRAYWHGELIDVNWDSSRKLWDFFWSLCAEARSGFPVDANTEERRIPNRDRKCRLVRVLPGELGELIVAMENGAYRLNLDGCQIRVFWTNRIDRVEEILESR